MIGDAVIHLVFRGIYHSSEGCNYYCYAFPSRPKVEALDTVIIGVIPIFYFPASVLFHHGSTYSYVSICLLAGFDLSCDRTLMPVHISTLVEEPLLLDSVSILSLVFGGL